MNLNNGSLVYIPLYESLVVCTLGEGEVPILVDLPKEPYYQDIRQVILKWQETPVQRVWMQCEGASILKGMIISVEEVIVSGTLLFAVLDVELREGLEEDVVAAHEKARNTLRGLCKKLHFTDTSVLRAAGFGGGVSKSVQNQSPGDHSPGIQVPGIDGELPPKD
jgi:hypothetical protein